MEEVEWSVGNLEWISKYTRSSKDNVVLSTVLLGDTGNV